MHIPRLLVGAVAVVGLCAASAPVFAQTRLPPAPTATEDTPSPAQISVPLAAAEAYKHTYVLGRGDRLRIIVFGEPDLSGEFEIDANGSISLPLVGVIPAAGQTIDGLEDYITQRYNEYLRDPRVNLQVIQYRPFFILGEVKQPGNYPFIPGMTIKNAIALAGGYTVRGGPGELSIERANESGKKHDATEDTPVYPGDTIRVAGRLF